MSHSVRRTKSKNEQFRMAVPPDIRPLVGKIEWTAMVKEFGRAAVDREISRALRTPRNADRRYHEAIIALSRGTDGAAKIVTTNFDLLFERANRTLGRYVPPSLPDLVQAQPIDGIVYLHGRLGTAQGRSSGYVISSADFGRAYLAEGWASCFVRELRERYTIVLLGYSANDPPMRYVLEGLNSGEGAERAPIYAFATEGASATSSTASSRPRRPTSGGSPTSPTSGPQRMAVRRSRHRPRPPPGQALFSRRVVGWSPSTSSGQG